MLRALAKLVSGAALAVLALGAVFVIGMRTGNPAVVGAVRRFNRRVTNPRQMRTAGTPGASAAILRHVGRASGTAYETPVGPTAIDDGFVIMLPYGTEADWLKNVLASGSATLVHEGATHEVDRPEVVPTASVMHLLSPSDQKAARVFGVQQCLNLRGVEPSVVGGEG